MLNKVGEKMSMIKGNFKDKNTQMELLEKKNIVHDVKNPLGGFIAD